MVEKIQPQGNPIENEESKLDLIKKKTIDEINHTLKSEKSTASVNLLKSWVSQDKNRFTFDGFDLDLTYITPRIIAMGLPSTSVEGLFRNNMEDVKTFFHSRHPEKYKVYNLCEEKKYPEDIFYKQAYFPFKDHEAPPLNLILPFCLDAKEFLDENPENVVAIHCKAGKGRTGTFISCLLLYLNDFPTAAECLKYYGMMRVETGKGVTVPNQIRYVYYFENVLVNKIPYPLIPKEIIIRRIRMHSIPSFSTFGCSCTPTFEIENGKNKYKSLNEIKKETFNDKNPFVDFLLPNGFKAKGDIKITFTHFSHLGKKEKMFKFWFNSFFVPEDGVAIFSKDLIDKACKDKVNKRFKEHFKIEIHCILID